MLTFPIHLERLIYILMQNHFFSIMLQRKNAAHIKGTFVVCIRIVFINYLDSYFVEKYPFYSLGILSD